MREIKFRAWDKDNSELYYVGDSDIYWTVNHEEIFFEEYQLIDRLVGGEHEQTDELVRPDQILMQYTGLKDKNRKEIYEGDILEVFISEENAKVITTVFWYYAGWYGTGLLKHENKPYNWNLPSLYSKGKIIGNIHEDPELVK